MKTLTPNQATLNILLSRRPQRVREKLVEKLYRDVENAVEGRVECPECGDKGPHDDNGQRGEDLAFACSGCGTHFSPPDVVVEV